MVEELKNEPETCLEDKKCENGTHSSVTSRSEGHGKCLFPFNFDRNEGKK